jgi:hypothetical protein
MPWPQRDYLSRSDDPVKIKNISVEQVGTVMVNVTKNRRRKWWEIRSARMSSSASSSHLHPPPKVPEHTDNIERIDSTRNRRITGSTITVIHEAEVERLRYTQLRLFLLLVFLTLLRIARLRRRRGLRSECIPSRAFSVMAEALALLRASETDIGEKDDDGDVVLFGVPLATSPAGPPCSAQSSADRGKRCWYCQSLVSASRVTKATCSCSLLSSSSSSELSTNGS